MKKYIPHFLLAFVAVASLSLVAAVALAQTSTSTAVPSLPIDMDSIGEAIDMLERAYQSQNWALLFAALLTIVVLAARNLGLIKMVKPEHVPYVAMGLASATSMVVGLQAGKPVLDVLVTGTMIGLAAVGGWEVVGKKIRDALAGLRAPPSGGAK